MSCCAGHETKEGYLGAYFQEGFNCPLILQVVDELRAKLPTVIGDLPLTMMWGYKYLYEPDQASGLSTHADAAQVNLNLWISASPRPLSGCGSDRCRGSAITYE